jgi:hypothetical protein
LSLHEATIDPFSWLLQVYRGFKDWIKSESAMSTQEVAWSGCRAKVWQAQALAKIFRVTVYVPEIWETDSEALCALLPQ